MRNKGFFWFLTILLAVVCVYQLSFTWVSNSVEKKAEKEAVFRVEDLKKEAALTGDSATLPNGTVVHFNTPEAEDLAKAAFINQILKEKANDKVYPVIGSSFQDVKARSLAFGLDLVGGMSVTLEISIPELVASYMRNPRDLKFKRPYEAAQSIYLNKGGDFIDLFTTQFKKLNGDERIIDLMDFSEIDELDKNSTNSDVASFLRKKVSSSMDGVEQIMSKRINQFGVAQPNIQKDPSTNRLYIELPGVQDDATVAEKIQSTANLQFFETYTKEELQGALSQANILSRSEESKIELDTTTVVDSTNLAIDTAKDATPAPVLKTNAKVLNDYLFGGGAVQIGYVSSENKEKVNKIIIRNDIKRLFPADMKFMWSANLEKTGNNAKDLNYVLYAVKIPDNGKAKVGGKDVATASIGIDPTYGTITVDLKMTLEGAEKWGEMTTTNTGKFVAITMDDVVYSSPRVNEPIMGGSTQISGNFTKADAEDLTGLLNGGSLPAPCVIKELTKVGPTIGAENSQSGLISFALAFVVVLLYMIFYYGKGGLVANATLLINILLIFGSLASFGAVLTLAGLAGIVLTIGMAVDANVLIFERIREEQKNGVDLKGAVDAGFSKALSSIIDANVTTLLTAIVLKVFGTGPIESFATTLIIGIFTSVFCAVVVSRLIINNMLEKGKDVSFSTSFTKNAFANLNFNFVGKRKLYYAVSGVIVALGLVAIFTKGLNSSVEFSGGRTYGVKFSQKADIEAIKATLGTVFVENGKSKSIEVKTKSSDYTVDITTNFMLSNESASNLVTEKLKEGLDAAKAKVGTYEILDQRSVSASVSKELISSSAITIVFSLIIMFGYILFRFGKWQFSAGAMFALIHDVVIVLSVFAIFHGILPFNMDVDQSFIAAVLTVIGYSINDTVVVFDRIRENLSFRKSGQDQTLQINDALNSTLARTFNTSMTTFIVLLIIFIFGGAAIKGFVFALMVGIIVGTYSSLCIATPVLIDLSKKDKI
jgi:SecD/SecF fusion protein